MKKQDLQKNDELDIVNTLAIHRKFGNIQYVWVQIVF